MSGVRVVVFVVFDGMKLLDVAGPAEVFAEANRFGAPYRVVMASVDGRDVVTSVGTRLAVSTSTGAVEDVDTVVVSGGDDLVGRPIDRDLVAAVQALRPRTRRMASICTGSFILAQAGLLDGRRATTHWRQTALLSRAYPRIDVEPDAIFVRDGESIPRLGYRPASISRWRSSRTTTAPTSFAMSPGRWWCTSSGQADSRSFPRWSNRRHPSGRSCAG